MVRLELSRNAQAVAILFARRRERLSPLCAILDAAGDDCGQAALGAAPELELSLNDLSRASCLSPSRGDARQGEADTSIGHSDRVALIVGLGSNKLS
jgi:hypothetical protein